MVYQSCKFAELSEQSWTAQVFRMDSQLSSAFFKVD
jgi:hypothetical protein